MNSKRSTTTYCIREYEFKQNTFIRKSAISLFNDYIRKSPISFFNDCIRKSAISLFNDCIHKYETSLKLKEHFMYRN